jgi:hypothetical protein
MSFIGNMWKLGVGMYVAGQVLEGVNNGRFLSQMRDSGFSRAEIDLVEQYAHNYFNGDFRAAYRYLKDNGCI